jgi:cell division protein FtsB
MIAERRQNEMQLRRYLLGQAGEEEQRAIEHGLLTDQEYFDQLLKREEELIDEYACGAMQGADKECFEKHFLATPERRENLAFAQALHRYFTSQKRSRAGAGEVFHARPIRINIALTAAVAVLAVVSALLLLVTLQLRRQVEQNRAELSQDGQREKALSQQVEQQREQLNKLNQELARLQSPIFPVEPDTMALLITPGMTRAGDPIPTANLGPGIHRLRLALKIEDGSYRSYQVELQTAEGQAVWSRDNLKARRSGHLQTVEIVLPTTLLTRSDYLAVLTGKASTGIEKIGTYHFSIVRK